MATSIEDALELIYKNVKATNIELIPIENSLNRTIAENIKAKYPLPNFDNSAMDGYGVSIINIGKKVKIIKTIFAGDEIPEFFSLTENSAIKIMTGAKIPKGVNAIIPFEDIPAPINNFIEMPNSIEPLKHIRKKGEDIEVGEILIKKGEKINPYIIGVLASQGISHIQIHKKPKVIVFATGKELKMHYENIEPHQLYNTNSPMILAKSQDLGAEISFIKIATDSKNDIKKTINNSLDADLIVTSGGVSVGEADFTKESFFDLGLTPIFEKVEIKPGKPTTFGKIGKTAVLNLAGNPSAGLINFEIFGKAIILTLAGNLKNKIDVIECEILEKLSVKSGKSTVILGNYDGSVFKPLIKRAPGMVKPLMISNGFIILNKNISKLESGSIVRFIPTSFQWFSDFQKQIITESF